VTVAEISRALRGKLIVSCQAGANDTFRDSQVIAKFAAAAVAGGAAAIRANGPADVHAIRQQTDVPIIGIQKALHSDGCTLITPSLEAARDLVLAGASMVAMDCTRRAQDLGALNRIRSIHAELNVPVLADVATVEEAAVAASAGADFILSTLRGYTNDTSHVLRFQPEFIREIVRRSSVPVIAEGRIHSPKQASEAISAGAFAVVVGTAITRPQEITRAFVRSIGREVTRRDSIRYFIGIDLGGTFTKYGIVSSTGELIVKSFVATPANLGRHALLQNLKDVVRISKDEASKFNYSISGIGIATAGWVNAVTGQIEYATENLPGWTGTPVAEQIRAFADLPVAVENDANANAVAEKCFGAAQTFESFLCVTLGTGVGGGSFLHGSLHRGSHFFANAFGHIPLVPDGIPCTCGQKGCLEVYCNAGALMRYAEGKFSSSEDLISAANGGNTIAVAAINMLAHYLARGCSLFINLFDPEALILSGGLCLNNPKLLGVLQQQLPALVPLWERRHLSIISSQLGYYGGVLGAAAVAAKAHEGDKSFFSR
jgi:glucokinase-like ROK family protein